MDNTKLFEVLKILTDRALQAGGLAQSKRDRLKLLMKELQESIG